MEGSKASQVQQQNSSNLPSILDPSAILQVDGSIEPGLGMKRAMRDSTGREYDSEGRLIDTDKWDNHNTIARGWLTSGEDHYQPVTFRKIYNSKNQPMGVSPMPNITHADMEQMAQAHQMMPNDNNTVPVDVPEEGCADL